MSRDGLETLIVGGGPAGLYLSILLAQQGAGHRVRVLERNQPGDAYGFGVVFSDETLDNFQSADRESYATLVSGFRRWGEIRVHHPGGREFVSGGHGFSSVSRKRLLEILTQRAETLGVAVEFGSPVPDLASLDRADLIVGADGANSTVRRELGGEVVPTVDERRNHYIWFGTDRVFTEFNFIFIDTPHGMVWAHVYPYSDEGSTFIVETSPGTWAALGFDATVGDSLPPGSSDQFALERCTELFSAHLGGHRLIGNNSRWLRFPTVTCARWHHENVVLIGDAAHTAHFSVGSGTKLAMEDAISLSGALAAGAPLDGALVAYEMARRPEVQSLQRAARASLEWFEGADRYRSLDPEQFVFSMLTRSQRVTYDNLRVRDARYMESVDSWYASADHGFSQPIDPRVPPMFHPLRLRDLILPNRIVVSPMDQYTAVDGMPNEWHLVHLGSRAVGGAGLVMTEMTCVSREARISPGCTGIWSEEQADGWARVVDFVHEHTNSRIGLQIGHAGRKGSTKLMWEGDSEPLESGNWDLIAPSPIPYRPDSQIPKEMTREDMGLVVDQHLEAARLGDRAGFDLLELHFAHGYLLSSFLTPLSNQRGDEYGGSLQNRMRFPLEVFAAVREAWPEHKPISVRISATDWVPGGFDGDDAVAFVRELKALGCDIVDVSTGQTTIDADPDYGRLYQTPYSDRIRHEAGIPTMTVGAVSSIDDVHNILVSGRADLCVLARPHLVDPYWTLNAAIDLGYADFDFPNQYLSGLNARRRLQDPIPPEVFRG